MIERLRIPLLLSCLLAIPLMSHALRRDQMGGGPGLAEVLATLDRHDGHPWGGAGVPIRAVQRNRVIVVDDGVELALLGAIPDARVGTWISFQGRFDANARGLRVQQYHVHHLRIYKVWISVFAAILMLLWWCSRHRLIRIASRPYLSVRDA